MSEIDFRRPDFVAEPASVPVPFLGGATFFVPKPWLEIRPHFAGGVAVSTYSVLTYGRVCDALIEAAAVADDDDVRMSAVATLAAALLGISYDLADPQLDTILAFDVDEPTSCEWACRVMDVACGRLGRRGGAA